MPFLRMIPAEIVCIPNGGISMSHRHGVILAVILAVVASGSAFAVQEFDQNITPEVIFGAGNLNGSWTTERVGSLEIGLRAKLRYDAACTPQNIFNSNGDGTYSFPAGVAPDGPGGAADCSSPETPVWSFEWSVNSDDDDASGNTIDNYTYELGLDFDPSLGTSYCTFDNISPSGAVPFWDHALGDNTTPNGGGTSAGDAGTYAALLSTENVVQNSWRYDFFDAGSPCGVFDPNLDATYDIYLRVIDGSGAEVARGTMQMDIGLGGPAELPMSGTVALVVLFAGLAVALVFVLRRVRMA
jgi:hypothetical protein